MHKEISLVSQGKAAFTVSSHHPSKLGRPQSGRYLSDSHSIILKMLPLLPVPATSAMVPSCTCDFPSPTACNIKALHFQAITVTGHQAGGGYGEWRQSGNTDTACEWHLHCLQADPLICRRNSHRDFLDRWSSLTPCLPCETEGLCDAVWWLGSVICEAETTM